VCYDVDFSAALDENTLAIGTFGERIDVLTNIISIIERFRCSAECDLLFVPEAEWSDDDQRHFVERLEKLQRAAGAGAAQGSASAGSASTSRAPSALISGPEEGLHL
jgi:hypothetical protein